MKYFENKNIFLYLGDSLEIQKTLPSDSVDCIVTSPPYFGLRDYHVNGQYGKEKNIEDYVYNLSEVFKESKRLLKPSGTFWLNIGDSYARDKNLIGIPWIVALQLKADGWILRNSVIWEKTNAMPQSVTDRLSSRYENIFLFSKNKKYNFNLDDIRVPASEYKGKTWNERKKLGAPTRRGNSPTTNEISGFNSHPKGKNPGDVWPIGTQGFKEAHFATYPEEIPRRAILAGSSENEIILDPFSGSGTTGKVALSLNRKYIGIDISKNYHDLSLQTRLSPWS